VIGRASNRSRPPGRSPAEAGLPSTCSALMAWVLFRILWEERLNPVLVRALKRKPG
jgi:hypothetical protein